MGQERIDIDTREEYLYAVSRGYEPLLGASKELRAVFVLPIALRRELQAERFKTLEAFYRFCYAVSGKRCEETGQPIPHYSAVNISHILTRKAHPAMAVDPRNFNLLLYEMHNKWEFGDRASMRIYGPNQPIAEQLKLEYYTNAGLHSSYKETGAGF